MVRGPIFAGNMLAARPVPLRQGSTHVTVRRAARIACTVHLHSRARVGALRAIAPPLRPPSSTPQQCRRGTNDRHATAVTNAMACPNPTDAARFRLRPREPPHLTRGDDAVALSGLVRRRAATVLPTTQMHATPLKLKRASRPPRRRSTGGAKHPSPRPGASRAAMLRRWWHIDPLGASHCCSAWHALGRTIDDKDRMSGVAGRIGMVVADFDDTCTQGDTIGILMDACINAATLVRAPCRQGDRQ
jgi:hypothetical protein